MDDNLPEPIEFTGHLVEEDDHFRQLRDLVAAGVLVWIGVLLIATFPALIAIAYRAGF